MSFLSTIETNRKNFLKFNDMKYERFQQLITNTNIKKVINAIPMLLSVNDPKIPGYVEASVPMGIFHYEPDRETVKYLASRFHRAGIAPDNRQPFIEMLAVMGSVGTIAYTKQSDFDYWVCVDKKRVSGEMLKNFQKKIDAIQSWAMSEIEIEVHLFINDIHSLKNNIYAEDEDEAFGSTIGATLKDEFYRSSIIIAGKIPFWWVVPRIGDSEYETLYSQMPAEIRDTQYIDLGNL
jgi:adenylate cyclase class 1